MSKFMFSYDLLDFKMDFGWSLLCIMLMNFYTVVAIGELIPVNTVIYDSYDLLSFSPRLEYL
jgi:hypothetical protein